MVWIRQASSLDAGAVCGAAGAATARPEAASVSPAPPHSRLSPARRTPRRACRWGGALAPIYYVVCIFYALKLFYSLPAPARWQHASST